MKRWMHTSGGNHLSKRRRIAKRKKAAICLCRAFFFDPGEDGTPRCQIHRPNSASTRTNSK